MGLRLTWLDVFTARRFSGNGLAVIHDADGLDDETMLAIARETRLSETTFVQAPTEAGADYRNRIWMATGEIGFAGHPSLGTAVAVARAAGAARASYVQETSAGAHRIDVELDGDRATASILQSAAVFGELVDPVAALAALSLSPAAAHPTLAPQVVSTGLPCLLVPLADLEALAAAGPDAHELRAITSATGTVVVYAFVAAGPSLRARGFFDQGDRIAEDPATGSAAGPLVAYLERHAATSSIEVRQGLEMARPSMIRASVEAGGVRVAGDCVVVFDGKLRG